MCVSLYWYPGEHRPIILLNIYNLFSQIPLVFIVKSFYFLFSQGPENSAFLINIHEPIIWRLHEMIQQVDLSRLYKSQTTTAVSVDPVIQIGYVTAL